MPYNCDIKYNYRANLSIELSYNQIKILNIYFSPIVDMNVAGATY